MESVEERKEDYANEKNMKTTMTKSKLLSDKVKLSYIY